MVIPSTLTVKTPAGVFSDFEPPLDVGGRVEEISHLLIVYLQHAQHHLELQTRVSLAFYALK